MRNGSGEETAVEVAAVDTSEQPEEVVNSWALAAVGVVVRSSGPGAFAEVAECSLAVVQSLPAAALAILLALPFQLPWVQPLVACPVLLQLPA